LKRNALLEETQKKLDEQFMLTAIRQAEIAEENGDVPIGAIIVHKQPQFTK
jgi:tRNA(Arg) A34 adenosine deaminase TadA